MHAQVGMRGLARRVVLVAALVVAVLPTRNAAAADPVIAVAGDIACSSTTVQTDRCHQKATSDLLVNAGLSAVLTVGDAQYQDGTLSEFMNSYDKSWGRVKSITYPSVGNHEYQTTNATGYFDYFNGVGVQTGRAGTRGKGYYSYDIGTWHLIALNSSDKCLIVSCAAGSAQETWLKADLAAHPNYCTLAYWHHPSFNSGNGGNLTAIQPLLQDLYNADADVIVGGHAHHYERFAPQNPSGSLDNSRGIRQFIVGTGGAFFTTIGTPKPNSQIRQNTTYGVLKLTLHATSYDWVFVPEAGRTFTDSGSASCHGTAPPSDTTKPTAPSNLTATPGAGQVALSWSASTDNVGVTGYRIFRGTTQVGSVGGTTRTFTETGLAPGSYSYTVRAVDAAGNVSDPSNTASATVADTTKPTAPTNLSATPGASQVSLSWSASSDNVGVTGYRVFRGTSQVGSVGGTTTSFTETGLSPGTYSYTVRAVDAAGNVSDPSNAASATVGDTIKPTAPTNLTATGGSGQVALSWSASTDNIGVTGYRIFRGTTQVGSVGGTTTSFTDTAVPPGTYSYTVRAVDAAGNVSDPSNAASATVVDTTKPTAPANLTATPGAGQVALSWTASTDNVAVTGYRVFRGTTLVTTLGGTTTSYTDTGLAPGSYSYTVRAIDAAGNISDPSNTASATVSDTTQPTAPTNLSATPGTGQVALNWTASTDNIGVTGYRIFRGTAQVGSVGGTTTSFTDTGVAPGTYSYTVRAVDAAGNVSDPSNAASATVLDVTKPSAPANLTASAQGAFKVKLNWDEATDDVGVTGYDVYRNGEQIATTTSSSYSDTPLLPGSYTYFVRAFDAAGNVSDPSNSATFGGLPSDSEKPTAPANLTAVLNGSNQVDLTWEASTDNVGVAGYDVYRDGTLVASIGPATSYADTAVPAGDHTYTVQAFDAAGNLSDPSNTAVATVPDTQKPTAPQNLTATAAGSSRIDLSWTASTDNIGVTAYEIYRDGSLYDTIAPATSYSDNVLPPATHSYVVRALDAAGNRSDPSNSASATVNPSDAEKPSPPTNLVATPNGPGRVDLSWTAAFDNVGVTGYRIFRGTTQVGSVGGTITTFTETGLAAGTYSYTVRAVDAAGNVSDPSNSASATVPDTTKPTPPANLAATPGTGQVSLTWQASSDDVGVTGYRIFRGTTQVGSVGATTTSFTETGLAPGSYSYTVRAVDAAGNVSDPSNAASATVPDTTKPNAPAGLAATAVGANQVNLTWQPATDNVGVTGYNLYRNTALIATLGATTSYSDTSVSAATTYSYVVRAVDAAGNLSDPSNTASATTPVAGSAITLSPDADAMVQQASPTTNFGADTRLGTDFTTSGANIESFLRFTVSGVPAGSVQSAKLRLRTTGNGTANGPPVYTSGAAWSESTINWNTRPATTSAGIDDKGALAANTWVEYDVTPFVTGGGTYSFRIATSAADGVYFFSREAADFRPELVVTTGAADTTKPTPPANLSATASAPNRIDLTWLASTDNIGVTGYNVYRGGALLAGIGVTTSYADTTVSPSTTYAYQVRALDDAGNISDPSNTASATTPAAPSALTVAASADARVEQANSATNFGTSTYLRTDNPSGAAVESYLRFSVTGIPVGMTVVSAKLRVHSTSNGTVDGPAVSTSGTSWTESTVDWNTRPTATSAATDDKGSIPGGTWVEYNVTPFVTGNGTFSFRLATTSTDGVNFDSREAAANRPELVLTLG